MCFFSLFTEFQLLPKLHLGRRKIFLKSMNNNIEEIEDIESDYDFSNGIQGKHYKEFACGYTVTVYSPNKSTCEKQIVKKTKLTPEQRQEIAFELKKRVHYGKLLILESQGNS